MHAIKKLRIECTSSSSLRQRSDFDKFDGCSFNPLTKTVHITIDSPIHAIMVLRYLGRHFNSGDSIEPPILHQYDSSKWRFFFDVVKQTEIGYYVSKYTLHFKTFQQYVEAYGYLKGLSYEEKYFPSIVGPHVHFL